MTASLQHSMTNGSGFDVLLQRLTKVFELLTKPDQAGALRALRAPVRAAVQLKGTLNISHTVVGIFGLYLGENLVSY